MNQEKWLICGTRKKGYKELVKKQLDTLMWNLRIIHKDWKPSLIIEGCCPDSADAHAEEWAKDMGIEIKHFPSTSGNYLRRNIEMINELSRNDRVIAFWDGFSYGTAHTIANAVMRKIPVNIIKIKQYALSMDGGNK